MLRARIGLVIGTPGYQLTGGARGEGVVLCSVFVQLYDTLHDQYIVLLVLLGPMTSPIVQPIAPGAGTDWLTDCTPFGAFRRGVCHDWSSNLTAF